MVIRKNIIKLETERLILRPFTREDFEAVHSWAGNPANGRYMSWGPNTEEDTRTFLASAKPGKDFAVVLKENGRVIGSCGVYPDSGNDTGELGWILHMDYWQRGYGTELGGELIRYGFADLKLRRLIAPCAAVNYGSYRVMERNGMRREALHRKAFWARVDKEWIDLAVYAILREEYEEAPTRYIALLRGINVGGKNIIDMRQLKSAFTDAGFTHVSTYINSGNVIFHSEKSEEAVQANCEALIQKRFGFEIPVAVIAAKELEESLDHAPDWWGSEKESKHNAIFVIAPATAEELCAQMGEINPEYEKVSYHGRVIFWSAATATFSRTRWSKVSKHSVYQKITIRNFNTAKKLLELAMQK